MGTYEDYMKTRGTESSLFEAAKSGDLSSVQQCLERGEDINSKNSQGHSALMLAAYYDHFALSQFLIHAGADVNSTDDFGNSILMGVSFKGHVAIARLLIAHGAKISATNKSQQTALMFAQLFGRADVVNLLEGGHGPARKIRFYEQALTALRVLSLSFTAKYKKGAQHV